MLIDSLERSTKQKHPTPILSHFGSSHFNPSMFLTRSVWCLFCGVPPPRDIPTRASVFASHGGHEGEDEGGDRKSDVGPGGGPLEDVRPVLCWRSWGDREIIFIGPADQRDTVKFAIEKDKGL